MLNKKREKVLRMLESVKSGSIHIATVSIPLHELSTTWNNLKSFHVLLDTFFWFLNNLFSSL
jgi:hypothetical protein